ncbi:MAG: hypothetical protein D6771_01720 [Zetaproteobacteria bacterium]|nr:MAG: hypothetical protein D6771_01720 [Zetaproteobacteria bacterium]
MNGNKGNLKEALLRWTKRDAAFVAIVGGVVVVLALTAKERTVKPTPSDEVHRTATARAQCIACHGPDGARPWPKRHTQMDQCFLCHRMPEGWVGQRSR